MLLIQTPTKQIGARGSKVGLLRRILMVIRIFPLHFQSFEDEDRYAVPARSILYIQAVSDARALERKKEYDEKMEVAKAARGGRVQPVNRIPFKH